MANFLYNVLFKRSSTYTLSILVGCFIFERGIDLFADKIFEQVNQGKLWKHIKHQHES